MKKRAPGAKPKKPVRNPQEYSKMMKGGPGLPKTRPGMYSAPTSTNPANVAGPTPLRATHPEPHPQLSVGGNREAPPEDVSLIISCCVPGEAVPQWVSERYLTPEERQAGSRHLAGGLSRLGERVLRMEGYPSSTMDGGIRTHAYRGAVNAAQEVLDAGGRVHLQCSQGQIRSVSLAAPLVAHLHPELSGDQVFARLVNLRPESLQNDEHPGKLSLLGHAKYFLDYQAGLDWTAPNIRWI